MVLPAVNFQRIVPMTKIFVQTDGRGKINIERMVRMKSFKTTTRIHLYWDFDYSWGSCIKMDSQYQ